MIEVALPGARGVFTGRTGGTSSGPYSSLNLGVFTDDDRQVVQRNLDSVRDFFGLTRIQLLQQVHGDVLVEVGEATQGTIPVGDAAITTDARRPLLITGADCPTVFIASQQRLAALHCGWKPVAAGIIERVAREFAGEHFEVAIGPGICRDHFEVGEEVVEAMGEDGHQFTNGRQMDLAGIIRTRARRVGARRVQHIDRCTYCEPEQFFSYRRDGAATGRQTGLAWRI